MDSSKFDYAGYYLIVLTQLLSKRLEIISRILHDCWSLYIVNVHILSKLEQTSDIALYTYFPFDHMGCEQVNPVVINSYINESFYKPIDLFPNKFNNMHNCKIIVAALDFPPYTIVTKNMDDNYVFGGIEGNILQIIGQQMNFSLIINSVSLNYQEPDVLFEMVSILTIYLMEEFGNLVQIV